MSLSAMEVRNPRTGRVDCEIAPAAADEVAEACQELRAAQRAWARRGFEHRIAALRAWRDELARDEAVLAALCTDTGRRSESVLEVQGVLASLDRWCELGSEFAAAAVTAAQARPSSVPFVHIEPDTVAYGLVGVISPWNFPLLLAAIDTVPALLAGCAVLVKPSEITPRFIAPLQETVVRVPGLAGVLRFLPGGAETGMAIVDQVDLVCFTGSVDTGRNIGVRCAGRLIPAYLELGGKDPAIVTASADLDRTTSAVLWGSVVNAGQSCLSIERIYVEQSVVTPFAEQLAAKAQALELAYPALDSGQLGPIISEKQVAILESHLHNAYARGARALCGGEIERLGGGCYCRPTVLVDVDHTMKVMREESFGPFMPVMPFTDLDEAVQLANDTEYGLSAAVFAGTEAEALAIARRLDTGAISINDAGLTALMHDAEKTAFKHSGMGPSRMGPSAWQRFLRRRACLVNTSSSPDPWWF